MNFEGGGFDVQKKETTGEREKPFEEDPEKKKLEARYLSGLRHANLDIMAELRWSDILTQEFINSEKFQKALADGYFTCLRIGDMERKVKLEKEFDIPAYSRALEGWKEAAQEGASHLIRLGKLRQAAEMIKALGLKDTVGQEVAKEEILARIREGNIDKVQLIIREFEALGTNIVGAERQEAVAEGVVALLEKDPLDGDVISKIHEINFLFNLPDNFFHIGIFHSAAQKALKAFEEKGDRESADEVRQVFGLAGDV